MKVKECVSLIVKISGCIDMNKVASLILVLMVFSGQFALAQVYRWVDEQGNVHFGDKKPKKQHVEDISSAVSKTNIDESSRTLKKLENVHAENEGERQVREGREKEDRNEQIRQKNICAGARRDLRILQGRVFFTDKDGKSYDISEAQRKIRAAKFEAEIRTHCS